MCDTFDNFGGGTVGGTGIAEKGMDSRIAVEDGLAVAVVGKDTLEFLLKPLGGEILLDKLYHNRGVGDEVDE